MTSNPPSVGQQHQSPSQPANSRKRRRDHRPGNHSGPLRSDTTRGAPPPPAVTAPTAPRPLRFHTCARTKRDASRRQVHPAPHPGVMPERAHTLRAHMHAELVRPLTARAPGACASAHRLTPPQRSAALALTPRWRNRSRCNVFLAQRPNCKRWAGCGSGRCHGGNGLDSIAWRILAVMSERIATCDRVPFARPLRNAQKRNATPAHALHAMRQVSRARCRPSGPRATSRLHKPRVRLGRHGPPACGAARVALEPRQFRGRPPTTDTQRPPARRSAPATSSAKG